jgi:hypothetical protein
MGSWLIEETVLEYEARSSLVHAKRLGFACWDALGEAIFVDLIAGPPEIDRSFPLSMSREAAQALHHALGQLLGETAASAPPGQ